MAEIEQTAPTFVVMGKTEAVASEDKVTVYFGTADKKRFKLGFHADIIPNLLVELGGRMGALRPTGRATRTVPLQVNGLQMAMKEDGTPALIVEMDGYEVAIDISRDGLRMLHEDIGQMLKPN